MNVLQLNWGNGQRCREWDIGLVGSHLVCRYGGWKEGVGGWVAGVRVLWKDSDTAMRPGAVCVGWHLPYSRNPVFLQLAGYYTPPPPPPPSTPPFFPPSLSFSFFFFFLFFFFLLLLFLLKAATTVSRSFLFSLSRTFFFFLFTSAFFCLSYALIAMHSYQ